MRSIVFSGIASLVIQGRRNAGPHCLRGLLAQPLGLRLLYLKTSIHLSLNCTSIQSLNIHCIRLYSYGSPQLVSYRKIWSSTQINRDVVSHRSKRHGNCVAHHIIMLGLEDVVCCIDPQAKRQSSNQVCIKRQLKQGAELPKPEEGKQGQHSTTHTL